MTEVLILILLGLAGYLLYKALRKKPKAEALPQRTDLANLTIKDASRGTTSSFPEPDNPTRTCPLPWID